MWPKPSPADAHDAARFWAHGQDQVQLMLMMLASFGHMAKTSPADAHDAGRDWARGQNQVPLMLMMLAGFEHMAKTKSR